MLLCKQIFHTFYVWCGEHKRLGGCEQVFLFREGHTETFSSRPAFMAKFLIFCKSSCLNGDIKAVTQGRKVCQMKEEIFFFLSIFDFQRRFVIAADRLCSMWCTITNLLGHNLFVGNCSLIMSSFKLEIKTLV